MLICKSCFSDEEIKNLIDSGDLSGLCDVCGSNGSVYDTTAEHKLQDAFYNLIRVYRPGRELPKSYPHAGLITLVDELRNNWSIFSNRLDKSKVSRILTEIIDTSDLDPSYLREVVGIPELYDEDYLLENQILRGRSWEEFKENVKYQNRYFSNFFNAEITERLLSYLIFRIEPQDKFFRARINRNEEDFSVAQMGAPPANESMAGRINANGIRCLYLGDSIETCIHEVRASEFDFVSTAEFHSIHPVFFIDLGAVTQISPFMPDYVEPKVVAVNRQLFLEIDREIGQATRREIREIEYVPTQCFSDLIKNFSNGDSRISGLRYKSVMYPRGYNIASFYPDEFYGSDVTKHQIKRISYEY